MPHITLQAVDEIEILTLQDNYIEMTAMDNSAVINRGAPLKEGEIRASFGFDKITPGPSLEKRGKTNFYKTHFN